MAVKPIPEGYHSVTPCLVVDGAAKVLDFVKEAFGAEELMRMDGPGGTIGHAEFRIGDSIVMVSDASAGDTGRAMPGVIYLFVENADAVYNRALETGGTSIREPADQFYGDRNAAVRDPAGNQWWISTHVEDVPPDEMAKRLEAMSQQSS